MTKREKVLAIAVGGLVAVVGIVYGLNKLTTAYTSRDRQLIELQSKIRRQERTVMFGKRARREMEAEMVKSLPSNRDLARSTYQTWLLQLAHDQVKLEQVSVDPRAGRPVRSALQSSAGQAEDLYYEHSFMVNGKGGLNQLVEFLYEFYRADYLHRIRRLDMQPLSSNKLNLTIAVQALSLENAPARQQLNETPAAKLAREDIEEYVQKIAHRNLFSPANKPPKIAALSKQTGNPNKPLQFKVVASDPDKDNTVSYDLVGDALEGATIDPKSGLFRWTPSENGEYQALVRATDSGLPALSVEATIQIVVQDPPPQAAKQEFDAATMAQVTGITAGSDQLLWVTVHTEGRVLKLRQGDEIEVGTVKGTIAEIDPPRAKIKTETGELIIHLGKNLVEM